MTVFEEFVRPDSPIPRQVLMPDLIRVRDLYLRACRHAGVEMMILGARNAEGEASDSPVPHQVKAPESPTPPPFVRKRRVTRSSTTKPKNPKVLCLAHLLPGWSRYVSSLIIVPVAFFHLFCLSRILP